MGDGSQQVDSCKSLPEVEVEVMAVVVAMTMAMAMAMTVAVGGGASVGARSAAERQPRGPPCRQCMFAIATHVGSVGRALALSWLLG